MHPLMESISGPISTWESNFIQIATIYSKHMVQRRIGAWFSKPLILMGTQGLCQTLHQNPLNSFPIKPKSQSKHSSFLTNPAPAFPPNMDLWTLPSFGPSTLPIFTTHFSFAPPLNPPPFIPTKTHHLDHSSSTTHLVPNSKLI